MSVASEDRILHLLRTGTKVQMICDLTSWPRRNVTRIAARNGFLVDIVTDVPYKPDGKGDAFDETADSEPPNLRSVPPSPPPRPPSVLERAEASPAARTRQLGARIESLMEDLAQRLKEEAERERAKQEKEAERERAKQEKEAALAELLAAQERARQLGVRVKKRTYSDEGLRNMQERAARMRQAKTEKRQQRAEAS